MHFKAERDFSPTRRKKERCTERNKQREKNIENKRPKTSIKLHAQPGQWCTSRRREIFHQPEGRKKDVQKETNKERKTLKINDQKPPSNCTLSQVIGALQGGERFFTNQKEERKMYRKKQTKREKH